MASHRKAELLNTVVNNTDDRTDAPLRVVIDFLQRLAKESSS
jgi:hypothetical protein